MARSNSVQNWKDQTERITDWEKLCMDRETVILTEITVCTLIGKFYLLIFHSSSFRNPVLEQKYNYFRVVCNRRIKCSMSKVEYSLGSKRNIDEYENLCDLYVITNFSAVSRNGTI